MTRLDETGIRDKREAIDRRVGGQVKQFRQRAGLSQSALAGQLGVSFQQLQKYEKGRDRMAVSTLCFIAEILDVPIQKLIAGGDEIAAGNGHAGPVRAAHIVAFSRIADARLQKTITALVKAIADQPRREAA